MSILFLSVGVFAKEHCTFNTNKENISIKWTAYKTPAKAPAEGTFNDIKYKGKMTGDSILRVTKNITATLDSMTVNSNKPERDANISNSFFKLMKKKNIVVKVLNATEKNIEVEINMNGKKQKLIMESHIENDILTAEGIIDVLNFNLGPALQSLSEACKALHENKTWPDVKLNLTAKFEKKCK